LGADVYVTEYCQSYLGDYDNVHVANGTILIRSWDGINYTVYPFNKTYSAGKCLETIYSYSYFDG
jgi:hypothetical protein